MSTATSPSPHLRQINILVIGAGAIGCFYAARLQSLNGKPAPNFKRSSSSTTTSSVQSSSNFHIPRVRVSLVCRSNYTPIRENGIDLQTENFGNYNCKPFGVYSSVTDAQNAMKSSNLPELEKHWHYVVITTKALPDITDDSKLLIPLFQDTPEDQYPCITLIQNGIGIEEPYRTRFPRSLLLSAVTLVNAEQLGPNLVRQNFWTRTLLGPVGIISSFSKDASTQNSTLHDDPLNQFLISQGTKAAQYFANLLIHIGGLEDTKVYDPVTMQLVRWHKLAINVAANPNSVLAGGVKNVDLVTDPEVRQHMAATMQEVKNVAEQIYHRNFPDYWPTMDQVLQSWHPSSGNSSNIRTSMLIDWERSRPLEIEVLLGNPLRLAREHNIDSPRLQSLYALLRLAQKSRLSKFSESAKTNL